MSTSSLASALSSKLVCALSCVSGSVASWMSHYHFYQNCFLFSFATSATVNPVNVNMFHLWICDYVIFMFLSLCCNLHMVWPHDSLWAEPGWTGDASAHKRRGGAALWTRAPPVGHLRTVQGRGAPPLIVCWSFSLSCSSRPLRSLTWI